MSTELVVAARRAAIEMAEEIVRELDESIEGRITMKLERLADGASSEVANEFAIRSMVTAAAMPMAIELAWSVWNRRLRLEHPSPSTGAARWEIVLMKDDV